MSALANLADLTAELDSAVTKADTLQLGDKIASAIVAARSELRQLGVAARDELALMKARATLDTAQERVTVRWDTRPSSGAVLRLMQAADCGQDDAVALLGGHP